MSEVTLALSNGDSSNDSSSATGSEKWSRKTFKIRGKPHSIRSNGSVNNFRKSRRSKRRTEWTAEAEIIHKNDVECLYTADELLMKFRTNVCTYDCKIASETCFNSHRRLCHRRVPIMKENGRFSYIPVKCPSVFKDGVWTSDTDSDSLCEKGSSCHFAHSWLEVIFHPLLFRTKPCMFLRDPKTGLCLEKGVWCAKAHKKHEIRSLVDIYGNDWKKHYDIGGSKSYERRKPSSNRKIRSANQGCISQPKIPFSFELSSENRGCVKHSKIPFSFESRSENQGCASQPKIPFSFESTRSENQGCVSQPKIPFSFESSSKNRGCVSQPKIPHCSRSSESELNSKDGGIQTEEDHHSYARNNETNIGSLLSPFDYFGEKWGIELMEDCIINSTFSISDSVSDDDVIDEIWKKRNARLDRECNVLGYGTPINMFRLNPKAMCFTAPESKKDRKPGTSSINTDHALVDDFFNLKTTTTVPTGKPRKAPATNERLDIQQCLLPSRT